MPPSSFRNAFPISNPGHSPTSSHFPFQQDDEITSKTTFLSFALHSFNALPLRRRIVLLSTFIIGVLLTAIMKQESLIWLLTATAGAAPILGWEQGSVFDYSGLRFGHDGRFQITVFSDLHLGDGARPGTDWPTIGVMDNVLWSEPGTDLVVLNGDLISCEWVDQNTANGLVDMIIDPLIRRNMPFTATFGNHDASRTCSTKLLADRMWSKGNSPSHQLTWTANSLGTQYEGVGASNYYIPIYSSSGSGNPELKMLLWFFDSKGGAKFDPEHDVKPEPESDWVSEKVVSWFKLTRDQIRADHGGKVIPSLAFVHIPLSITEAFRKSGQRTETTEPGISEEIINVQADDIPGGDLNFLQALSETEGLIAAFSGHDHKIDWCMKYSSTRPVQGFNPPTSANDMSLCFGRHTGYGGYSDYERGAREIIVQEDKLGQNIVDTYIRLEGGRVSGYVTLNSTFGLDQYPPVQKNKSWVNTEDQAAAEKSSFVTPSKPTSTSGDAPTSKATSNNDFHDGEGDANA
ncbi:Metallo-dependent phosphatase [Byssothecium circinans]|uniref:Metallo-dependent phosphatase n=1 Tax=Byssothecium circinans TaxID=147558 RepID=A0A6A5TQV1_9PLEO|nr:Metallo-dependent phosphatase [Byssothecium circinans]